VLASSSRMVVETDSPGVGPVERAEEEGSAVSTMRRRAVKMGGWEVQVAAV